MILPIYLYGHPVLRKKAEEIDVNYPNLKNMIEDMFETMYKAEGIGLAAPQIGESIRLVVVDTAPMGDDEPELKDFKRVFINPNITANTDETISVEEGCLSVPGIRESVKRYKDITVEYFDENFEKKSERFDDFRAIVLQHEFDHLEGKVFTDKISGIKKHIVNKKLNAIKNKKITTFYKSKF